MSIFNLSDWNDNKILAFVKNYSKPFAVKTAMGYTRQQSRDPYAWWDYEVLASSPDRQWTEWVQSDPSLNYAKRDAGSERGKAVSKIMKTYGLSLSDASKLVKTYVGYHPSYGGYICQIGPYFSKGERHGIEHVVTEAVDKFSYYVLRKRKSTPEEIGRSIARNIDLYKGAYNVEFTPADFSLVVKAPKETFDYEKQRQEDKDIVAFLPTLDENDPHVQDFYRRSPLSGIGTHFDLNSRGYEKILRGLLGPWYNQTVREKAAQTSKTQKEIVTEIITNMDLLREIYNASYKKWEEARESGEAAAVGMTPPPKFLDPSLKPESGAQTSTSVRKNKAMGDQLRLRIEIIGLLQQNVTSPSEIADRLNADPVRRASNERRRRRVPPKPPIIITTEEVQRQIDEINRTRTQEGGGQKDLNSVAAEVSSKIGEMEVQRGYDDMRTAFNMAAVFFSSQPVDPVSKTMLGAPDAIVFNPPENFENFTSQDLKRFREEKENREEATRASPEQVQKDIGEKAQEPSKTKSKTPTPKEEVEEVEPSRVAPETTETLQHIPSEEELRSLMGSTLNNLIKIAEELDNENSIDAAEEVHKVIRKYIGRVQ